MTDSEATDYEQAESPGAAIDPHRADPHEDPEQHIGAPMADPWDDEAQTDWETHTVDVDPRTMGV